MSKTLFICPFSGKVINNRNQIGSYVRYFSKKHNISCDELKYKIYCTTFGPQAENVEFRNLYLNNKWSLVDFAKNWKCSYVVPLFLIKYHQCQKRTLREAVRYAGRKAKITNMQRYGVDHIFKVKEFNDKRIATYRKKYGVDNPFKQKDFFEKIEKTFLEKYGRSRKAHVSLMSKAAWAKKTQDERNKWLDTSIMATLTKKSSRISKIELLVGKALLELGIKIESQYRIGRLYFDFYIKDINIVIEVNGDYYHANPLFYKKNDYIQKIKKTAEEVWIRDAEKKRKAEEKGFLVLTLWENDVKLLSNKELEIYIYECLQNYKNKQNPET